MKNLIIAGTDTGIGKTLCSALLMSVFKGTYFKPIQSGSKEDNDTEIVKKISELNEEHFLKEKYLLKEPLSPHLAAELENITIDDKELTLPKDVKFKPLIVELAGGLMVPINRQTLMIDLIRNRGINVNYPYSASSPLGKNGGAKVILCARTALGAINHALLSIEALKVRNIDIAGIVFIGEENVDNKKTILQFSGVKELGYIPQLDEINREILIDIFYDNFDVNYFKEWLNNYEI